MAKVCFLLDNHYEDSEMTSPYEAVKEAGHEAVIVGIEQGVELKGKKGASYQSDMSIDKVDASDYDAVIIPGGSAPEALRVNDAMVQFVKDADSQGKVIAGICHGPQVMISADILNDKQLTCYVGIRDDVKNAGGQYKDEEVVVDGNLITSRTPKDEPAFIREILNKL